MKKVKEQKKIQKMHFTGIKEQQKMVMLMHNINQDIIIIMDGQLKKMKLVHLNGLKNQQNKNKVMHKIIWDTFMKMVQE